MQLDALTTAVGGVFVAVLGGVGKTIVEAVRDRRVITESAETAAVSTEALKDENTRRIIADYGAELDRQRGRLERSETRARELEARLEECDRMYRETTRAMNRVLVALDAYETRVQYLTGIIESAALPVATWQPPRTDRSTHDE